VGVRFLLFLAPCVLLAQAPPKKLLAISDTRTGYQHDSVSHALSTIERLGNESGLFATYIRTETQLVTKAKLDNNAKNLDSFDAVWFMGTGNGDLTEQQKKDLLAFVHDDGKGFIAAHSGADAYYNWPEYGDMIGGYFDGHPWGVFDAPVIIADRTSQLMKKFPPSFTFRDEIYVYKAYSKDKVHVLAHLDRSKLDPSKAADSAKATTLLNNGYDFPVAWTKSYGKGRVFVSTFGHTNESWDDPRIQSMYLEAIKWAMGITPDK
jgi:type 1 glutamine amidotransferase